MTKRTVATIEFQTLALIGGCYGILAFSTVFLPQISVGLAFGITAFAIAFHSSLQHEALHGHPTRLAPLNELLVFLPVGLLVPYRRFRDLHLAHHVNEVLTDPYDDPESNFLDPQVWANLPAWCRAVMRFNNTLGGRILIGPLLSSMALVRSDMREMRNGNRAVMLGWALHVLGLIPMIWWLLVISTMPVTLYLAAAYLGYGLLKIRTYLEHRARVRPRERSVVIERGGVLGFLFLNNNFHVVHHANPGMPWYRLPREYHGRRQIYLARNGGYRFGSYREVFRKYLLRAKDPVPHPLRKQG